MQLNKVHHEKAFTSFIIAVDGIVKFLEKYAKVNGFGCRVHEVSVVMLALFQLPIVVWYLQPWFI